MRKKPKDIGNGLRKITQYFNMQKLQEDVPEGGSGTPKEPCLGPKESIGGEAFAKPQDVEVPSQGIHINDEPSLSVDTQVQTGDPEDASGDGDTGDPSNQEIQEESQRAQVVIVACVNPTKVRLPHDPALGQHAPAERDEEESEALQQQEIKVTARPQFRLKG